MGGEGRKSHGFEVGFSWVELVDVVWCLIVVSFL